jgi:hypothetical protein
VQVTDPVRLFFGGFKSDAKEKWRMHNFVRKGQCTLCCERDDASRHLVPTTFCDFSSRPAWADTASPTHTFLENEGGKHMRPMTSPWLQHWQELGFLHTRHHFDSMHCLYKSGTASDLLGSVLAELTYWDHDYADGAVSDDGIINERLRALFTKFVKFLDDSHLGHHRLSVWTVNRICWTKRTVFPTLSDSYKCGDCRNMVLWLADHLIETATAKHALGKLTRYEATRCTCVWSLASWIQCLGNTGPLLTREEQGDLHDFGMRYLKTYHVLATINLYSRRRTLYRLRPKLHSYHHIILQVLHDRESPRTHEVWGEETLMGIIRNITRRCHSATAMKRTCERCIGMLAEKII